jgi:hypothetical protein
MEELDSPSSRILTRTVDRTGIRLEELRRRIWIERRPFTHEMPAICDRPTWAYILLVQAVPMLRCLRGLLFVSLLALGCGRSDDASAMADDADNELKTVARCEQSFAAPLRAKVAKARTTLEGSPARFAADVREALDDGRVKVLPFCSMTPEHFEHFKKDADLTAFGSTPEEQYRRLRAGETRGMREVHEQLYGYMWDERIYVATNMNQEMTLETLAHEVRHVLRRAHVRNFDDQRVTCVEELEAARAEVQVHKDDITAQEDRALLDRVHDLYELDKLAPGTCGYR